MLLYKFPTFSTLDDSSKVYNITLFSGSKNSVIIFLFKYFKSLISFEPTITYIFSKSPFLYPFTIALAIAICSAYIPSLNIAVFIVTP